MRAAPLVVLLLALVSVVHAAPAPPAGCEQAKLKAAGTAARGVLTCHAKAVAAGAAVDPDCVAGASAKLAKTWAKAEGSACVHTGEMPAVASALQDLAADLTALTTGGPSACDAKRLRGAATRAQKTLLAEAKHAAAPERSGLGLALGGAAEKFAGAFAKAAAAGDCTGAVTAPVVADRVDAGVAAAVDAVRGTLAALAAADGRLMGAAVRANVLAGPSTPYHETLLRHFDFLTAEYELMWGNIEPTEGAYLHGPVETILGFAETHALPVKGAPLVWHLILPAWVDDAMTPAELQDAVNTRIDTLVGGYAGRIATWDVVNEAVNDGSPGYRSSIFLSKLGPAYVKDAFVRARQADPTALLFYNDFLADGVNAKSDFIYSMIAALLADGAPIDGVSFQMHLGGLYGPLPTRASVIANLERFAALGLRVRISEMDVQTSSMPGKVADRAAGQRAVYRDMVSACLAVPACDAITFWGFTDAHTWIRDYLGFDDVPLPFDAAYLPKAAFFGVRDALAGY